MTTTARGRSAIASAVAMAGAVILAAVGAPIWAYFLAIGITLAVLALLFYVIPSKRRAGSMPPHH